MSITKYIFFIVFLSITVLSKKNLIASDIASASSEEIALPKNYKHYNVSQQIENYRKIYALAEKSKPIPGLFNILKNAFALINDQIVDGKTRGSEQKEEYLISLTDLWIKSKKSSDTLTSSIFQGYNKNLSYIIDCYKKQININVNHMIRSNPLAYPDWMQLFRKSLQDFKDQINKNENNIYDQEFQKRYIDNLESIGNYIKNNSSDANFILYGFRSISGCFEKLKDEYNRGIVKTSDQFFFSFNEHDPNTSNTVFIIYGLPKSGQARNISPSHFVEQWLDENCSACVSFFDVLSRPKYRFEPKENKLTRKDPHWSMENGTEKMLLHDFNHMNKQISSLEDVTIFEYLREVLAIQRKLKAQYRNNEGSILMNGLFMIIHERPDLVRDVMKQNPGFRESSQDLKFIESLSIKFKNTVMTYETKHTSYPLSLYGSDRYKQENRDWEFILKDKYVEIDGSIKPVHDEKGTFLPIEYNVEQKKMTRPFDKDPNRDQKMTEALNGGYSRFWTFFLSIIEKNI